MDNLRTDPSTSLAGCDCAVPRGSDTSRECLIGGDAGRRRRPRKRPTDCDIRAVVFTLLTLLCPAPAWAVVLSDGEPSLNTSAPADDPGWDNVGVHGAGSAVYLGNQWVLTADHLNPVETITFQGIPATVEAGSEVVLRNPEGMDLTEFTDLRLVRLADDPGLPSLTITGTAPEIDDEVLMIGRGRDRENELTIWEVSTFGDETSWIETEFPPYDRSGYLWRSSQTMRWGTNFVVDDEGIEDGASEFDADYNIIAEVEEVDLISLATRFEEITSPDAADFESHATLGDSGGGVFYEGDGQWELAGIMFAVANSKGQPEEATVFGNATLWADLTFYREQIENIIASPLLEAGDADQNLSFDQFDLVRVAQAAKYLTGETATWGDGDWNGAPGGAQGRPPVGNGVFDQFDIIESQVNALYLAGPYAAVGSEHSTNSPRASVVYDASSGELAIEVPDGIELTSINIDSAGAIFDAEPAASLGGFFDLDSDESIFKATFGSTFSSLSFGNVAAAGLEEDFILADLNVVGSLAGGGPLDNVDVVYRAVPEPSAALLLILGLALAVGYAARVPFSS